MEQFGVGFVLFQAPLCLARASAMFLIETTTRTGCSSFVRTATAVVIAVAFDVQPGARADDLWQLPATPVPALGHTTPVRSCESLMAARISAEASVRDARVVKRAGGTDEACRLTIEVTAPPAPIIAVWVLLPTRHWNGRFLGLGGGGWIPGFPAALDAGASRGFATAITNAGRPYDCRPIRKSSLAWSVATISCSTPRAVWIGRSCRTLPIAAFTK